jgi:methyl-accepting chemotaxis protein WspA
MKTKESWFDRKLSKISYSTKLRVVLLFGYFGSFFATFAVFYIQYNPIHILELKLIGLEQHRNLSDLMIESYEIELLLHQKELSDAEKKESISTLVRDFETSLNNFQSTFLSPEKGRQFSDTDEKQGNFLVDKLTERWIKLKQEINESANLSILTYIALIDDILNLMDFNIHIYKMRLNNEISTFLLMDIAVLHLPYNQAWIGKIVAKEWQTVQERPLSLKTMTDFKEMEISLKASMQKINEDMRVLIQGQNTFNISGEFHVLAAALLKYEKALDLLTAFVDEFSQKLEQQTAEESLRFQELGRNALQYGREVKKNSLDTLQLMYTTFLNELYHRQNIALIATIIGVMITILVYFTQFIRRPLENLRKASEKMIAGDLTVRVATISKDEIGKITHVFNEMAEFFETVMAKVKGIIARLVKLSDSLSKTIKQLESNILSQEKEIHLIASQAKKIALNTNNFANSLKEVNKVAAATSRLARLGTASLTEMDNIMQQMGTASKNIVSTLSTLKEHVDKINSIINAIVKIADQSNLLSLNTAIRASKTGAIGIGFTVVANRIRELADQTAYATLDIEKAVQGIVSVVSEAAGEVDKFSGQILGQVEDDKHATEELKKLIGQTQQQLQTFDVINSGMEEQLKETLQIQDSLTYLGDVTHQTTRSFHQLYNDIQFLYSSVQSLQEVTNKFHIFKEESVDSSSQ